MVRGEQYQSNTMLFDDDEGSLSRLTFGSQISGGVPTTVMMNKCSSTQRHKQLQRDSFRSVSTCTTSCSSSSATSSSSQRSRSSDSSKSSKKSLSKQIITQLREELVQVKEEAERELSKIRAEAESNLALAQKLHEENQKIRQEANEAYTRADRLEREAEKLSSTKKETFGWTWRGATRAIQHLQSEVEQKEETVAEEISNNKVDFDPSASLSLNDIQLPRSVSTDYTRSCMKKSVGLTRDTPKKTKSKPLVTIQVPSKEKEIDKTMFSTGFLSLLKRAGSSSQNTQENLAVVSKEVTAEALLWESYAWNSSADFGFNSNDLTSSQRIGASFGVDVGETTMKRNSAGFKKFGRTTYQSTCSSITE